MKRLIIVRHAKSSWEHDLPDFHRSLIPSGIERAEIHAELLREKLGEVPAYWVSSFATRALHTAIIFARKFDALPNLKVKEELYTFSGGALLSAIASFPDEMDYVILFSHNDACQYVVNRLTGANLPYFKTASVAYMEFNQKSWAEIADGNLKFIISQGKINL